MFAEIKVARHVRGDFWYNTPYQKHSCFDRLKRNLENFFCTSRQRRECALLGRVLFRVSYRAFQGLS